MRSTSASCLALAAATVLGAVRAEGQGMTEWSAEARTVLSFHVPDAAAQALLPAGWTVDPSTGAANKGANLTVTVMERLLVQDAQGKNMRSGTIRYAVMSVPARHTDGRTSPMIVLGISPEGAGAYGAYLTANVSRLERASSATAEEAGRAEETWEFGAATGDRLELRLAYRRAAPVKAQVQTTVRSGVHPAFTRTYRISQASDVIRSLTNPVDRVESLQFKATGPRFAPLFDGTERLLSLPGIPWYVREISIP